MKNLTVNESKLRDIYLRDIALGNIQGPSVGKASIDKPWLKYYETDAIMADLPKMSAYEYLFNKNIDSKSDALNFFGLKTSYKQFFKNIDIVASKLQEKYNVMPNDVVVINSVTLPQTIYLMYALNKIGAIADITDVRTDSDGMKHYLNEGKSKLVFTMDMCYDNLKKIVKDTSIENIVTLSPMDTVPFIFKRLSELKENKGISKEELIKNKIISKELSKRIIEDPISCSWNEFLSGKIDKKFKLYKSKYEENRAAVIVHTSGTTGEPKSVVLTNENFNGMALQYGVSDFKYTKNESILNIVPIFTAYGAVNSLHMPLCLGITNIVYPKVVNEDFTEIIRKFKPNHVIAIPMHWNFLLSDEKMKNFDMSFLKTAACGGDNLSIEIEKKLNEFLEYHNSMSKVVKGYGMTEVSACAVTNTNNTSKLGSVGIPLVKNNIKIINPDTKEEVCTGETGEICIQSPTLMKEYFNNESETSKMIEIDKENNRWIHSGDLGHFSEDGKLDIDGRIKRLIIRRGFKVSAVAIENAILTNDSVDSCVVVKCPHEDDGEVPYVFIVLKEDCDSEKVLKEIKTICEGSLPDYYIPNIYKFVSKIPYTKNNKVDISLLEKIASEVSVNKNKELIKKQ